jgi:hypothetical protein
MPGVAEFYGWLAEANPEVEVFFVTSRLEDLRAFTARNLGKLTDVPVKTAANDKPGETRLFMGGFVVPIDQPDGQPWPPGHKYNKFDHYRYIEDKLGFRTVLRLGDNASDFHPDFGSSVAPEKRLAAAERHASRWGRDWIQMPNPVYGGFLQSLKINGKPVVLVQRDRIVAHSHAGSVVDGVGHSCSHAADAQLSDALGLHRRGHRVGLVQEDHVLVRDVGMDRHLVAGQVVVDEEAQPLVDDQFLHQRRTDPHRHGADHLAARGLRVEDAAGGADASMRRTRIFAVAASTPTSTKWRRRSTAGYCLARSPYSIASSATTAASPAAWASGSLRSPQLHLAVAEDSGVVASQPSLAPPPRAA